MAITDTCIYLEAIGGDNGVHDPAGVWWLSPDLTLNAGTANESKAIAGANTIKVTVRRKTQNCQTALNEDPVLVDVYVGDPWVAPPTPSAATTNKISNSTGHPGLFVNQAGLSETGTTVPLSWTVSGAGTEQAGHRCLVVRCYRDPSDAPSATTFSLPAEQHSVQHNIDICPCASPCSIPITTTNQNLEVAEEVTLLVVADPKPARHVLNAARAVLKGVKDFKRLRTTDFPRFSLQLKEYPDAKISDFTGKASRGKYGALKVPNYAAQIRMKPKQTIKFGFQTDLEKARFGDAFIFHLTHVVKRQVLGGLTVVAVRTKSELKTTTKTKPKTRAKR